MVRELRRVPSVTGHQSHVLRLCRWGWIGLGMDWAIRLRITTGRGCAGTPVLRRMQFHRQTPP